jgi:hypothetical protein
VYQFGDCFPCAYEGRCDTGRNVGCNPGDVDQMSGSADLNELCSCTQIAGQNPTVEASSINYMGGYTATGSKVNSCATNSPGRTPGT